MLLLRTLAVPGFVPPAFCPATPATRTQIALFLVRAFGFGF